MPDTLVAPEAAVKLTPEQQRQKNFDRWKRPNIELDTLTRLRDMLRFRDNEDLPDGLWVLLGLRMAIDPLFAEGEIRQNDLVQMAMFYDCAAHLRPRSVVFPGSEVLIKSQQLPAIYICRGPANTELVNRFGKWFVVPFDDLQVNDLDRKNSDVNTPTLAERDLKAALPLIKQK